MIWNKSKSKQKKKQKTSFLDEQSKRLSPVRGAKGENETERWKRLMNKFTEYARLISQNYTNEEAQQ